MQLLTNKLVYFSYRTSEKKQTHRHYKKQIKKKVKEMQYKYVQCYVMHNLTKVTGKTAKSLLVEWYPFEF